MLLTMGTECWWRSCGFRNDSKLLFGVINNERHIALTSTTVYHLDLYANFFCVKLQNH